MIAVPEASLNNNGRRGEMGEDRLQEQTFELFLEEKKNLLADRREEGLLQREPYVYTAQKK